MGCSHTQPSLHRIRTKVVNHASSNLLARIVAQSERVSSFYRTLHLCNQGLHTVWWCSASAFFSVVLLYFTLITWPTQKKNDDLVEPGMAFKRTQNSTYYLTLGSHSGLASSIAYANLSTDFVRSFQRTLQYFTHYKEVERVSCLLSHCS